MCGLARWVLRFLLYKPRYIFYVRRAFESQMLASPIPTHTSLIEKKDPLTDISPFSKHNLQPPNLHLPRRRLRSPRRRIPSLTHPSPPLCNLSFAAPPLASYSLPRQSLHPHPSPLRTLGPHHCNRCPHKSTLLRNIRHRRPRCRAMPRQRQKDERF